MENRELIVYINRAKDDSMEIHEQILSSVFPRLIMAWFSIHRTRSASLYAFQQCKCLFHNLHSSTRNIYCAVRQIRIFENRVKLTFPWIADVQGMAINWHSHLIRVKALTNYFACNQKIEDSFCTQIWDLNIKTGRKMLSFFNYSFFYVTDSYFRVHFKNL